MAVTKLPRTHDGTLLQSPPLSWPNNTAVGPRRPCLGLFRQATRNRQQHRMSNLSASSRHNQPKPTLHSPLPSQAPRASGYSRHKAFKRTDHSTQQSKAPKIWSKPPKQNEKLGVQDPSPHATQLSKTSEVPSNSLTTKKADAKSQKDKHMGGTSSSPFLSHIKGTLKLTAAR